MEKKITLVTVTYNAADVILGLIDSVNSQECKNFSWIIVDAISTDDTLEKLKNVSPDVDVDILCESDAGIYDAINKAVLRVCTDYYLVVGADDRLEKKAIANYYKSIECHAPDLVAAHWLTDGKLNKPMKGKGWLVGMRGVASSHSVSLLIKKELHEKFGLYNTKYPICADQLFVKLAVNGNAYIKKEEFVAGEYSSKGISGTDALGFLTDFFRVQMATEKNKCLQVLIFALRVLKNGRKICK
ncbi:glycosyltransferase [Vreelandella janggokensis]|uniref:glycosyltransferase n=1 Tax=Vreelandella janggokensis TaxID=370767 RepID=UPI002866E9C0|nr:glycosyltransferase [Halomonas janggokensis]MDR5886706.1 glycosyltransferase [Halomonas janggokensis]